MWIRFRAWFCPNRLPFIPTPSGTTACLGMIVSMYLDLTFRKLLHVGLLAKPMVATTRCASV